MKANIVDLRYHTKDILKAIDRNEEVEVFYRGKSKAVIIPKKKKRKSVRDSEFFGSSKDEDVDKIMQELRRERYDF